MVKKIIACVLLLCVITSQAKAIDITNTAPTVPCQTYENIEDASIEFNDDETFTVTVNVSINLPGSGTERVKTWIDLNGDGTLDESENVMDISLPLESVGIMTFSTTVSTSLITADPTDAFGEYITLGMRSSLAWESEPLLSGSWTYGDSIDTYMSLLDWDKALKAWLQAEIIKVRNEEAEQKKVMEKQLEAVDIAVEVQIDAFLNQTGSYPYDDDCVAIRTDFNEQDVIYTKADQAKTDLEKRLQEISDIFEEPDGFTIQELNNLEAERATLKENEPQIQGDFFRAEELWEELQQKVRDCVFPAIEDSFSIMEEGDLNYEYYDSMVAEIILWENFKKEFERLFELHNELHLQLQKVCDRINNI